MTAACWHCGADLLPGVAFHARTPEGERDTCCAGCTAAVEMIHRLGLEDYYRLRTENAPLAASDDHARTLALFSLPALIAPHLQHNGEHLRLSLQLGGIHCAACCWLIEKVLLAIPGVQDARVNLATMQLQLVFSDDAQDVPKQAAERLLHLGYQVSLPGDPQRDRQRAREHRQMLGRLILAGVGAMQAMMYAAVLYLDVFDGSDAVFQTLFRSTSLLIATPVVFYAGWPFFSGAWRGLRHGQLTMDLPVALALMLAWGGSVANMALGGNHVYFESAAMFVFFLLISRTLEQRQRHRIQRAWQQLQDTLPRVVQRQQQHERVWVSVREVQPGDLLWLAQGDTVPVDGIVHSGQGEISEAVLTGEARPLTRRANDTLPAGGRVLEGQFSLRATGTADSSLVARISEQVTRAAGERVTVVRDWQRVAPLFILGTLILAAATLALHWSSGPAIAFEHMLALLVITCPCALALAVPMTVSATLAAGLREGILVASPKQLLAVHGVRGVLFDKTGTLTQGRFTLHECLDVAISPHPESLDTRLAIAAALERQHPHPLARAFDAQPADQQVSELRITRDGAAGQRDGVRWQISGDPAHARSDSTCLLLTRDGAPSLRLWLRDAPRPEAARVLAQLRARDLHPRLASGDAQASVDALARPLHLTDARGQLSPDDKAAWLRRLSVNEGPQMMVGDGINDAPALLHAAVAVAPANATSLARQAAGVYLLGEGLRELPAVFALAAHSRRLILQNLGWALGYNLIAVPLAVAGFVAPWAAALGMAGSSLIVTLNANRMNRWKASSC